MLEDWCPAIGCSLQFPSLKNKGANAEEVVKGGNQEAGGLVEAFCHTCSIN